MNNAKSKNLRRTPKYAFHLIFNYRKLFLSVRVQLTQNKNIFERKKCEMTKKMHQFRFIFILVKADCSKYANTKKYISSI